MPKRVSVRVGAFLVLATVANFTVAPARALEPASSNFRFSETSIGNSSMLQSNSANFQSTSSTGDIGVGNSASNNFQVDAGTKTTDDPSLSVVINGNTDLGNFSPTTATTGTSTFTVLNYTSYGYVVNIVGTPPTHGGHTIAAIEPASPPPYNETSTAGFEQFGINLVANTLPNSVGANPNHGEFGFGAATDRYDDTGRFRYVSGEAIASATKSSGTTTYTISYLVNVGALTPGGEYKSNQTLIVTGTY